jgi:predicted transport protein
MNDCLLSLLVAKVQKNYVISKEMETNLVDCKVITTFVGIIANKKWHDTQDNTLLLAKRRTVS